MPRTAGSPSKGELEAEPPLAAEMALEAEGKSPLEAEPALESETHKLSTQNWHYHWQDNESALLVVGCWAASGAAGKPQLVLVTSSEACPGHC